MKSISKNEKKVLLILEKLNGKASPEEILKEGFDELVKVMNASSWLQSKGLVDMKEKVETTYSLSKEGEKFLSKGFPERKILKILMKNDGEMPISDIKLDDLSIALGWLRRKDWATIGEGKIGITEKGRKAIEEEGEDERAIKLLAKEKGKEKEIPRDVMEQLKKRGVVEKKEKIVRTIYLTEEGKNILKKGIEIKEEISQLTPELIKSGKWKKAILRPYDIRSFAPVIHIGKRHPLSQLIDKIREIFLEMGFTEIEGEYIESCFWNMDALFIPQDHPARDLQDTFYCDKETEIDEELLESIASVHESGGDAGSTGWGYKFSKKEARKTILRTHATVNTIRYLYENPEPPSKVFLIGKVFRRENMDATHLSEFHHIDGVIHERGANFRQLIGILKEFYDRMGFKEIRFRPAYFPYTEPSMEIEVRWHEKWIELGGSGIFRPEVTRPLGIKESVLAWGLGLERLAMILLSMDDIRDLYMSDVKWLREMPLL